ncbi:MAG: ABC transporter permease subunit [Eubacterium sp.]|nr:ABC transporter permease subunit [Eubacterium sp.]
MLNAINAEIYKTLHRAYFWIALGLWTALIVVVDIGCLFLMDGTFSTYTLGQLTTLPMYMSMGAMDIVFGEEYKHKTLKNSIAAGTTRAQIYFAKLAAEILVLLVVWILMCLAELLVALALLDAGQMVFYLELTGVMLKALPLYIAGLALANALGFLIPNATATAFAFVGIMVIPDLALIVLAYKYPALKPLYDVFIMTPLKNGGTDISEVLRCLVMGIAYFTGFNLAGWALFRRRELK